MTSILMGLSDIRRKWAMTNRHDFSTYPDSASHREIQLHKKWVATKGGNITHSTCDNEDAKRKKILGTLVASESWPRHFLPMTNVWFQSLKTFSELWSWPVWNFVCERRMNCHVGNMVCLSQRSQAKFSKYYIHTAHITICLQACLTMVRHGTLLMLWFD